MSNTAIKVLTDEFLENSPDTKEYSKAIDDMVNMISSCYGVPAANEMHDKMACAVVKEMDKSFKAGFNTALNMVLDARAK